MEGGVELVKLKMINMPYGNSNCIKCGIGTSLQCV